MTSTRNKLQRYRYSDFTASEREQIRSCDLNAAVAYRQSHFNNAVRFPFSLTETELDILSSIYSRQTCLMADTKLRNSSHPIPACMMWKATTDLYKEAVGLDGARRFIDIGGSVARVLGTPNAHGCLLSATARDRFRYLSTINSKVRSADVTKLDTKNQAMLDELLVLQQGVYDYAASSQSVMFSNSFCLKGADCCDVQATFAVSIHTLQKTKPQQVYDAFEHHGLNTMLAVIYLPQEGRFGNRYSQVRSYESNHDFYDFTEHPLDPSQSVLSFRDNSLAYVFDTTTWFDWFYITHIRGDKFDIIVEDYEQNGFEHRFRFTRVPCSSPSLMPRVLQPEILADYIEFPDMHAYILSNMTVDQDSLPHILIPKEFYRKCMNQALKPAELDNSSVHAYIIGITNRIDINTHEVNKKFIIDPITLQKFAYSMLFVAAARRLSVSTDAKVIYEYIRGHAGDIGLFDRFFRTIARFYQKCCFEKQPDCTNLANFVARPFEPVIVQKIIDLRTYFNTYIQGVRDPDYPTRLRTDYDATLLPDVVDQDDNVDEAEIENNAYTALPLLDAIVVPLSSSASSSGTSTTPLPPIGGTRADLADIDFVGDVSKISPYADYMNDQTVSKPDNAVLRVQPSSVMKLFLSAVARTIIPPSSIASFIPVVSPVPILTSVVLPVLAVSSTPTAPIIVAPAIKPILVAKPSALKLVAEPPLTVQRFSAPIRAAVLVAPPKLSCIICAKDVFIDCVGCKQPVCETHANHCTYIPRKRTAPPFTPDRIVLTKCIHPNRAQLAINEPFYSDNLPVNYDTTLASKPPEFYKSVYAQLPSTIYAGHARGAAKLEQILIAAEIVVPHGGLIADVGAGPGYCGAVFNKRFDAEVDAFEHKSIPVAKFNRSNYFSIKDDYEFSQTNSYFSKRRATPGSWHDYSFIFIDVQTPIVVDSPDVYCALASSMRLGSSLIVKFSTPDQSDYQRQNNLSTILTHSADLFTNCRVYKPAASPELSREFYLICRNRRAPRQVCTKCIAAIRQDIWFLENKRLCAVHHAVFYPTADVYTPEYKPLVVQSVNNIRVTDAEIFAVRNDYRSLKISRRINLAVAEVLNDYYTTTTHSVEPVFPVELVTGVFGCGKTTFYKQNYKWGDVIITPTNELCAEIKKALGPTAKVYTEHAYFTHNAVIRHLYIDEAFTFYPGKIALFNAFAGPSKLYLVGDPLQIPSIDFTTQKWYSTSRTLDKIFPVNNNLVTHTAPHDVTNLMRSFGYPGIRTTSKVVRSISKHTCTLDQARAIAQRLDWPVISYNQIGANAFGHNSRTVHESVGARYRNVILYIDPYAVKTGFTQAHGHVRVALTRHTDNLLIIGDADGLYRTAFHQNSAIDRNCAIFEQERTNVDLVEDTTIAPSVMRDAVSYTACSVGTAVTILEDLIDTRLTHDDHFGSVQTVINNNKGGRPGCP